MIPLLLFLLGCVAVYLGTVQAAFGALMRLPLRLSAERHGHRHGLGHYLEEPLRLFIPAGLLQAVDTSVVTMLALLLVDQHDFVALAFVLLSVVVFGIACMHVVPLLIVRRDPERFVDLLLPSFHVIATALRPVTGPLIALLRPGRSDGAGTPVGETVPATGSTDERAGPDLRTEIEELEERKLLRSVVEFGDTIVREVMTPRTDIVAVRSDASLGELRALFMEQHYSRLPVYKKNLDEIVGFAYVKDLVGLSAASAEDRVIEQLLRPAYVVPETERVAELLKQLQRQRVQSAIVHDEYGGTAGLVTIEDLLEEIVGEIQDEYDVEAEPIVDEGNGSFVFAGTVSVDDVAERLDVEIERQGFETIGGYLLVRLGRVPRVGETLYVDHLSVEILDGEERRVRRVRMRRRPESIGAEQT